MTLSRTALLLALVIALPSTAARADSQDSTPELYDHLPKDPLFIWAATDLEPVELWDGLLELGERFLPEAELEEMRAGIAGVDEALGMSLRDELLARIGPELAVFFDLPDLDETAQQVMMGQASADRILGNIGVVTGTRDGEGLEGALLRLSGWLGGEPISTEDLHQVRFVVPNQPAAPGPAQAAAPGPGAFIPYVDLFFQSRDGLLVLGFDQAFVESHLAGLGDGKNLAAGQDFQRVFAQLDRRPESLTYFNIPELVGRISGSQMVGGMMAASEEAAPMMELLGSPDLTGMGAGSTSVTVDGGRRTTTYGPAFLADTFQIGLVSAILVPNFLDALDKARHKRTVSDMNTAAAALETFSESNDGYPGPTEGWVPLASYREVLVSSPGAELSVSDGWGHELLYSSDGSSYRLVSPGKDGMLSDPDEEQAADDEGPYDADIVLTDGVLGR